MYYIHASRFGQPLIQLSVNIICQGGCPQVHIANIKYTYIWHVRVYYDASIYRGEFGSAGVIE